MEESYEGNYQSLDNDQAITLSQFMDEWIEQCYENLEETFTKESELKIADAVLTIFKTRNDLEIFKKKALYIYIREMTDCDTPYLTRVINVLKEDFRQKYQKLYDAGLVSTIPL